jgi:3-dehydroquinate dehydratase
MRYTVRYINAANEVINYLHTDDFSEAVNTEFELRDKGYNHQSVWIADAVNEILVG